MRLDVFLVSKNLFSSRQKAREAIERGEVFVDGKVLKPSSEVLDTQKIEILSTNNYVSRAALKLQKAVYAWNLDFSGKTVLDVGSSTGGFSQVALKFGAKKVIAVDVGTNQMDRTLRQNKKILLFEGQDIRTIDSSIIKDVDFVVSDVSFISLKKVLPKLFLSIKNAEYVLLFKPQFECGKELAKKFKGVINDQNVHIRLLCEFTNYLKSQNVKISGLDYSSIRGKEGNIEYLFYLGKDDGQFSIKEIVLEAFKNL